MGVATFGKMPRLQKSVNLVGLTTNLRYEIVKPMQVKVDQVKFC